MELTEEELGLLREALSEFRLMASRYEKESLIIGRTDVSAAWAAKFARAGGLRDRLRAEQHRRNDLEQLVELLGPMGWDRDKMTVTHVQDIDKGGRYVRVEQPDKGVRYVIVGRENPPYPVTVAGSRPVSPFKDHKGQLWVVSETNPFTTTKIGEGPHHGQSAGEDLKTAIVEAIREGFTYARGSSDAERDRTPVLNGDDWHRVMVALEQRQRIARDGGSRTVAARYHETMNKIREARNGD